MNNIIFDFENTFVCHNNNVISLSSCFWIFSILKSKQAPRQYGFFSYHKIKWQTSNFNNSTSSNINPLPTNSHSYIIHSQQQQSQMLLLQVDTIGYSFKLQNQHLPIYNTQSIKYQQRKSLFQIINYSHQIRMGVYLSAPNTKKHTNIGNNKELRYVSSEMQGWRKNMEDASITKLNLQPGMSIFGVFDGHGGPEVSKFVAKYFIKQLIKNQQYQMGYYDKALAQTFRKMDELLDSPFGTQQLIKIRNQKDGKAEESATDSLLSGSDTGIAKGTGCTANVILITPQKFYIANAGDSRCALSRSGKSIPLSYDHKPQDPIQSARITKAGATISQGRINSGLNLSRSIGDFYYKKQYGVAFDEQPVISKPDVKVLERSKQDQFIILGCDGIWQKYEADCQEMVNQIISLRKLGKTPTVVVEQLLDKWLAKDTNDGIGCDNMSLVLIQFNKAYLSKMNI